MQNAARTLAILSLCFLALIVITAAETHAQGAAVRVGGGGAQAAGARTGAVTDPQSFLQNVYLWFFGFIGIAALFSIVRGGLLYMYAGGNSSRVEEAKRHIANAFIGVLIAALSYLGLSIINPDFVEHGSFDLKTVIKNALPG